MVYVLSCNVEQISLFTSVTAFMDTSSMSLVGSFVVKCWSASPGAIRTFVIGESLYFALNLSSS